MSPRPQCPVMSEFSGDGAQWARAIKARVPSAAACRFHRGSQPRSWGTPSRRAHRWTAARRSDRPEGDDGEGLLPGRLLSGVRMCEGSAYRWTWRVVSLATSTPIPARLRMNGPCTLPGFHQLLRQSHKTNGHGTRMPVADQARPRYSGQLPPPGCQIQHGATRPEPTRLAAGQSPTYRRAASSAEIIGAWAILPWAGALYKYRYVEITADGRIGRFGTNTEPTSMNARVLEDVIDGRTRLDGVVNGWNACAIRDGSVSETPAKGGAELTYLIQMITSPAGADQQRSSITESPGDLIMRETFKIPADWDPERGPPEILGPQPWFSMRFRGSRRVSPDRSRILQCRIPALEKQNSVGRSPTHRPRHPARSRRIPPGRNASNSWILRLRAG